MSMPLNVSPSFAARTATAGALARPGLRALLEDEKNGGENGGAGAGAGGAGGTPPPAPNAELERLRKENETFRAAQKKRDDDEAAATDAKKKKAEKDGDLQAQLDAANAELAKAKAKADELSGDASFGKKQREQMAKDLETKLAKLSADDRALVEKLPLEDRGALADKLMKPAGAGGADDKKGAGGAGAGGGGGGGPGPGGTPPPGGAVDDIDALIKAGTTPETLKLKHGAAFEEWKKKQVADRHANNNRPPWLS